MVTQNSDPADRDRLIAALRRYIRTHGAAYLDDPNVSSVGIGHRVRDGEQSDRIALQFTVGRKARPEELEALGTRMLPKSVVVDGVEVPTDVLERSYTPQFRVVAQTEGPVRKRRLDPILPGASVGHVTVSAGTIGCIVYDRHNGTPYILSNWHVLHGSDGALGEDVVQPGRHDDDRVHRNRLGALARSHLGVAGDCAVATIEDRRFLPGILELDVVPQELGEPELGDRVVKSGRTTGVTHGVVRRIDTLVSLDYGGSAGRRIVGGFEIGPDPDRLPADGEISMGGDSGSVWMFTGADGRPGTVLAGLHFAGEGRHDPDEHALACLSTSVFEKLEIGLRPPDPDEVEAARGYDPAFLAERVEVPRLTAAIRDDAVLLDGSEVIPYTHFSLALSASRGFAFWAAWNIDGGGIRRLSRRGIPFAKDPRLPDGAQVGNELYKANRLDRGHLARRSDLLWGGPAEAAQANTDSFFYTNITPQADDFNQSGRGGLWGRLEDAVFADAEVDGLRVSVFGGPVLGEDDRVYRGVRIPREYWKVIAHTEHGRLKVAAFVLTQNLDRLEVLELDEFRVHQVTLGEVEERCHLLFPAALRAAETPVAPESLEEREPLASLADIRWS
ncbi:DNA/RNA non-specific endonuclease [Nocardiopsis sp. CC223A]|uniref:DNA/RNA non-specific endonuclease n=1 Tax=Nocardiopsis sp. CC223A TaxID=3044051 RepID=UPI00279553FE|nr:DNA/RNA non-specific endonuclease [Nocardiopsis sp. CC223A]